MADINGNWFHSRSSSNLSELLKVRTLVFESQRPEYIGFGWSGGRQRKPKMYQLASVTDIQPSAMQTKIRAMIRYGFLRDVNTCPLVWTKMGSLWNELYTVGNFMAARDVFELTLAISIALYLTKLNTPTVRSRDGVLPASLEVKYNMRGGTGKTFALCLPM